MNFKDRHTTSHGMVALLGCVRYTLYTIPLPRDKPPARDESFGDFMSSRAIARGSVEKQVDADPQSWETAATMGLSLRAYDFRRCCYAAVCNGKREDGLMPRLANDEEMHFSILCPMLCCKPRDLHIVMRRRKTDTSVHAAFS